MNKVFEHLDKALQPHLMFSNGLWLIPAPALVEACAPFENKLLYQNVPRGGKMPQTLEELQVCWARDQELLFEQNATISKLQAKINQLQQKIKEG